jgi:hypothetical protein
MFADPTWGFAMPAAYRRGDSGEESLLLRGIRGFGRRRARKMRKTTMRAARARLKRLKSKPSHEILLAGNSGSDSVNARSKEYKG